jgi:hypothetical protein
MSADVGFLVVDGWGCEGGRAVSVNTIVPLVTNFVIHHGIHHHPAKEGGGGMPADYCDVGKVPADECVVQHTCNMVSPPLGATVHPRWGQQCLLLTKQSLPSCCREVAVPADVCLLVVDGRGCEGGRGAVSFNTIAPLVTDHPPPRCKGGGWNAS